MTQIALFGTSADPPTAGHQAILGWLAQQFDYVAVWAANNPFKSHQTPLEHRVTMLRLLIDDLVPPYQNIQLHPELSYPRTLITVERAQQIWTTANFTLVIGSDLIQQLPHWYQAAILLQLVKLLVIPRPGYRFEDPDLKVLKQMGAEVTIAELTGLPVSSTDYRNHRETTVLTPPVAAYIDQKHLYSSVESQ